MGLRFDHDRVKELRALLSQRSGRAESGRFVVEGPVLCREAVAAGWRCVSQFVPDGGVDMAVAGAGEVFELAPGVFERVASTQHPQPPMAIVEQREVDVATLLGDAGFVVVLDAVSDPGNLGTIVRSAEAAGADLIVLTPGSVDPYNPKVVRASAGALFHVPVVSASIDDVAAAGLSLLGTSSHEHAGRTVVSHSDADLTGRVAIVMGNEAAGLPDDWNDDRGPISTWLTIRHRGRSESLNVAMAATILVFEAARQRPTAPSPTPIDDDR